MTGNIPTAFDSRPAPASWNRERLFPSLAYRLRYRETYAPNVESVRYFVPGSSLKHEREHKLDSPSLTCTAYVIALSP